MFLAAGRQVWAGFAMERLNLAAAIGLAFGDPQDADARRARTDTLAEAYPDD